MREYTVDVWEAFLDTMENRGVSHSWEVAPETQRELIEYFKKKIDAGVVDGKTTLPTDLIWNEYVWRFPDEMREELTEYARQVFETDSNNGAAAKFLAIVTAGISYDFPPDEFWGLYEKVVELLPYEVDICYYAFENSTLEILHEEGVIALERMFERYREGEKPTLYQWLYRCCYDYLHVTSRPTDFYEILDRNDPLFDRWTAVFGKFQKVFERQLEKTPDHWHTVRMLGEILEAVGDTDALERVYREAQVVYERKLEQDENDSEALYGLANIHEKFGNTELAREYKVRNNPSLRYEGKELPDFPSGTVDLDGKPISLLDYRGKVVLVDFWAVWCGPCLGEIPRIKSVYEKYHDKGFDVIGVSLDEDADVLRKFSTEKGISWRQVKDDGGFGGGFAKQYGIRSVPTPVLVDRDGKVISLKARGRVLEDLVLEAVGC